MKIANFDFGKKCQQIAEVTEGLSGREISKIAIAWQVRAYKNCNKTLINISKREKVGTEPYVHLKNLLSSFGILDTR